MKNEEAPGPGYAWWRLALALAASSIGACGMYVYVVVLPRVQADFGIDRSSASMPYTITMIGFGIGMVLMGRLADRHGVWLPISIGALCLSAGFVLAAHAPGFWTFTVVHGLLIGLLGASATFGPLVADTTLWFERHRGIAVAICASGNYLGGAVWPWVAEHYVETVGWRQTYVGIGAFCLLTMLPLAYAMRRRPPALRHGAVALHEGDAAPGATAATGLARSAPERAHTRGVPGAAEGRTLGMSPRALQSLLAIAGVGCCVAMSMPQVHIVAYCSELGYGPARGAQMLSLMLGFGVVSRLVFGLISDRIGGLRTLLLGSVLQGVALTLFLPFDGLVSLYVISSMFGLFQGGIVPSYAIIVREHFAPREAGERVGVVLMSTLFGMALGGWMSGKAFDLTGSYHAAFANGIAWNLLNLAIVAMLYRRSLRESAGAQRLSPAA